MNLNFPLIKYDASLSPREWGEFHGSTYAKAIHELVEIRRGLMLGKSPHLTGAVLDELAHSQWDQTQGYDKALWEELEGIRVGAKCSVTDIVILNNYTDFRDIPADEGCSTVYVSDENTVVGGQTWDMHSTARDYVCVISVPRTETTPEMCLFSLIGCVGMMGFNDLGQMVAINNLNTVDAAAGIIWPALVRRLLRENSVEQMRELLINAPVTSAHAYLLASKSAAELWEITPSQKIKVSKDSKTMYHTNHCLSEEAKAIEVTEALSQTTEIRLGLVEERIKDVRDLESLETLLKNHDNYPKAICSHFESGAQDPSFTCGGGIGDFNSLEIKFWRGCDKSKSYEEVPYKFKNV